VVERLPSFQPQRRNSLIHKQLSGRISQSAVHSQYIVVDRIQPPAPGFGAASVTSAESDIRSVAARLNVKF
jgi:hypothetical protein